MYWFAPSHLIIIYIIVLMIRRGDMSELYHSVQFIENLNLKNQKEPQVLFIVSSYLCIVTPINWLTPM